MTITNIEDLRRLARKRIPKMIFDYADRGSYDEQTIRANRRDFDHITLRSRVMVDVSNRSLETRMLGHSVSLPLAIAPTGLTGLFHGNGEILAARAAEDAGIPFSLSTMSICSIEDVRAAVSRPFWFQLYFMKDRAFNRSLIERAVAAQCSALILTLDLQVQGQRHQDIKNGLTVPPRVRVGTLFDILGKPVWGLRVLFGKRRSFGNLAGFVRGASDFSTLSHWIADQFDPSMTWKDVEWVRGLWPGKLILKGVLDPEDAKAAVAAGADGIVVSNHGGRQLDGAPSAISRLPGIVNAVGGACEILFDSGVRSGQDVLKALALGAEGCFIGKSMLYGLGAQGQRGVATAIDLIRRELDVSMALTGTRTIDEIGAHLVYR